MSATREQVMDLIDNLMAMWNSHDPSRAAEIYANEYRALDVTDQTLVRGPEGVARQLQRFSKAFPDLVFQGEETILERDRVAIHWSARGTHQGSILNIPPTGRRVHIHGVSMLCVENGKFSKGVHLWDMAGLLRAIGLLPELEKRAPLDASVLQDALTICE